ncbi:hypothetical protein [Citrobacter pasteurii]|nr:hypothetical protein [Citrobacter pasteurii]
MSFPDLPPAKLTEDRASRFSSGYIPAYDNGTARFVLA